MRSRGVKRPDIVKEILMFALWSIIGIKVVWKMEPNLHIVCHKI